jgi:hypothetical protein
MSNCSRESALHRSTTHQVRPSATFSLILNNDRFIYRFNKPLGKYLDPCIVKKNIQAERFLV